jgi:serine/threonine protein kinase
VKVFFKPQLKKQRSFSKSPASNGASRRRLSFITALDEVYREIEIMKQINNHHIIKLHEVIDDPTSDKLYLVMPVAELGECMSWDPEKGKFRPNHKLLTINSTKHQRINMEEAEYYGEDIIRSISRDLIHALRYLHSELNIVHRDIKP